MQLMHRYGSLTGNGSRLQFPESETLQPEDMVDSRLRGNDDGKCLIPGYRLGVRGRPPGSRFPREQQPGVSDRIASELESRHSCESRNIQPACSLECPGRRSDDFHQYRVDSLDGFQALSVNRVHEVFTWMGVARKQASGGAAR